MWSVFCCCVKKGGTTHPFAYTGDWLPREELGRLQGGAEGDFHLDRFLPLEPGIL